MKKITMSFLILGVFVFFCSGCGGEAENEQILNRLDAIEEQIAIISDKIDSVDTETETTTALQPSESPPVPTPAPVQKTVLTYETITDVLGKANIMAGLDDSFFRGVIWTNPDEFFIFLEYNCTLTEDVQTIINQNIEENFDGSVKFENDGAEYGGDGYMFHISQEDDDMISIGIETNDMETAAKVYQLDKDYFSSYEIFKISQDTIDQLGLSEPTHSFGFHKNDDVSISLDWRLAEQKAIQLYEYYAQLFVGEGDRVDNLDQETFEYQVQGYDDNGTELVFIARLFGEDSEATIKRVISEK